MKADDNEAGLRELIDGWLQAVRAKDVDGAISGYSPDVLVFDVVNPLRKFGVAALRKRVEEWFSAFRGPIGYEMRNLEVACAGDLAFCHSVNHISWAKIDGGEIDMWIRATVCFRKIEDEWKVVHEHVSVPFDPETGLASMDLEP